VHFLITCNIALIETEEILEDEDRIFYEAIEQHSITGTYKWYISFMYISFSYACVVKTLKTHCTNNVYYVYKHPKHEQFLVHITMHIVIIKTFMHRIL